MVEEVIKWLLNSEPMLFNRTSGGLLIPNYFYYKPRLFVLNKLLFSSLDLDITNLTQTAYNRRDLKKMCSHFFLCGLEERVHNFYPKVAHRVNEETVLSWELHNLTHESVIQKPLHVETVTFSKTDLGNNDETQFINTVVLKIIGTEQKLKSLIRHEVVMREDILQKVEEFFDLYSDRSAGLSNAIYRAACLQNVETKDMGLLLDLTVDRPTLLIAPSRDIERSIESIIKSNRNYITNLISPYS